jgi:hypothetical protein
MPEVNIDAEKPEEKKLELEHGFTKDGYLLVKIHISAGKWNLIGALAEAQILVMNYFAQMAQAAQQKNLVRPDRMLERFKNKWR